MLTIVFRNVARADEETCTSARRIVLEGDTLRCETPESHSIVRLENSMWWVNGEPFTSGEMRQSVMVTFEGGPTMGPCERLKIVAEFLYAGDTMLARKRNDKWLAHPDKREYDRIIISPD